MGLVRIRMHSQISYKNSTRVRLGRVYIKKWFKILIGHKTVMRRSNNEMKTIEGKPKSLRNELVASQK